nr:MAG TPA: hypothetical protein [Caudoviricetes sp.]
MLLLINKILRQFAVIMSALGRLPSVSLQVSDSIFKFVLDL